MIAMAVVCCVWLNPLRLRQNDLWDHVNYGRVILMAGELPAEEPLLPLSQKTDFINPAWGSQVLMALVVDSAWLNLSALQLCHALLVLMAIGTIGFAVGCRTGSVLFALVAAGCFLHVGWQQFLGVRPQTAGVCFFCGLFALLELKLDRFRGIQILIVLGFATWANLHGSFSLGLFAIGVTGIGRACDFGLASRRFAKSGCTAAGEKRRPNRIILAIFGLHRSGFSRLLALGICCAVATLVNPYGVDLYEEVLRVGRHPNMSNMVEWRPLSLSMKQGQAAAGATGVLLVALCFSKRRPETGNLLLVFLLSLLTLWSSRMINWWAPVVSYMIGVHLVSGANRIFWKRATRGAGFHSAFRRFGMTEAVAACIALSLVVATSSWGRRIDVAKIVETDTPVAVGQYLKRQIEANESNSEAGISTSNTIFCPAEWSGYLMSETRRNPTANVSGRTTEFPLKPMVSTHVHVIPAKVWNDFMALHLGADRSLQILDQYQINVVVIDRHRQGKLLKVVRNSGKFQQVFRSKHSSLWVRIPAAEGIVHNEVTESIPRSMTLRVVFPVA